MSFFVVIGWLGLRKSRTWLRPFSGHRRNRPGRGPLCAPPPPVHLLMQTRKQRPSTAEKTPPRSVLLSHSSSQDQAPMFLTLIAAAFPDSSHCTCGLNLGNVVSMLFRCRPQTDSFAWAHKLDHCHIPPIHPWPYTPSKAPTEQLSSKSWSWARHISDDHNNVRDRKQTCLIVSTAMTYRILTGGIEKSSLLVECRRLPTTTGWRAGSQRYLSINVTFRDSANPPPPPSTPLKQGGRSSAAQSLPVSPTFFVMEE